MFKNSYFRHRVRHAERVAREFADGAEFGARILMRQWKHVGVVAIRRCARPGSDHVVGGNSLSRHRAGKAKHSFRVPFLQGGTALGAPRQVRSQPRVTSLNRQIAIDGISGAQTRFKAPQRLIIALTGPD